MQHQQDMFGLELDGNCTVSNRDSLLKLLPEELQRVFNRSQDGLLKALGLNPICIIKLNKNLKTVGYLEDNSIMEFIKLRYGVEVGIISEKLLKL